ncbi:MAG TPA: hypothetical protein VFT66_10370 [Roseiflexaceae bacterium]|jgi:hypothetical protein|nr:hypothetical protein [Roseiflexaceae bacterium]
MMKHRFRQVSVSLLLVLIVSAMTAGVASAHGHTEVGNYELVIGFHNEPAYQGEPNGLDLFVTNKQTGEKINGLEDTLKAEIIFGGSKKELTITPQFGQDGAYTAYILPTKEGDYTWRIFGTIQDTPVDVSMTSSPTTFGSVEAKSAVAFPEAEVSAADLQAQAAAAAQTAQTALIIGIVGAVLGIIGIVAGAIGLRARRAAVQSSTSTKSVV